MLVTKKIFIIFLISSVIFLSINGLDVISVNAQEISANEADKKETFWEKDIAWIAVGVIVGAGATIFAIFVTVFDRRRDIARRVQDLIQTYSDDFRKISEKEKTLKTKLDCSLYVEQYLDALEMIATLSLRTNLKKEVSDFFSNNFSYGIHLWRWYMEHAVKFDRKKLDLIWELPVGDTISEITASDYRGPAEIKGFGKVTISEFKEYQEFLRNERWKDFREWCQTEPVNTPFKMVFEKFLKHRSDKDFYKILPDLMETEEYEKIPEEDGLTKGELVEIIRGFGRELSRVSEDEKNLKSDLDCSVYAERYLDNLEQIASLYKKQIIPRRAADYFENKFAYGINLWKWYLKKVLNYDEDKIQDLWTKPTDEKTSDEEARRYLTNERWREFRWWCREEKIDAFDEDDTNPLILPDRMWKYGNELESEIK